MGRDSRAWPALFLVTTLEPGCCCWGNYHHKLDTETRSDLGGRYSLSFNDRTPCCSSKIHVFCCGFSTALTWTWKAAPLNDLIFWLKSFPLSPLSFFLFLLQFCKAAGFRQYELSSWSANVTFLHSNVRLGTGSPPTRLWSSRWALECPNLGRRTNREQL